MEKEEIVFEEIKNEESENAENECRRFYLMFVCHFDGCYSFV